MRSRGSEDRLSTFRVLRELRRAVKANRRPVISADAARERYEPLIESLAVQLAVEFGVEWRRGEIQPEKRRRSFRTTCWVIDQSLSGFPEWEGRLDATMRRVFDIVGSGTPLAVVDALLEGLDDESPAEAQAHMAAQQLESDTVVWPDGDEPPVFLPLFWSVRDRMGGDIHVTVHDDRTNLWAAASVKPS